MKSKLILMCAMVAILLSLCACSTEVSVDASCDDFTKLQHISKEAAANRFDSLFSIDSTAHDTEAGVHK